MPMTQKEMVKLLKKGEAEGRAAGCQRQGRRELRAVGGQGRREELQAEADVQNHEGRHRLGQGGDRESARNEVADRKSVV